MRGHHTPSLAAFVSAFVVVVVVAAGALVLHLRQQHQAGCLHHPTGLYTTHYCGPKWWR